MKVQELDRGFPRGYPLDTVYVINGQPITKADILENKRRRQRRQLEWKRRNWESTIKPCLIWTFYNPGFIYGGWWLYVLTTKKGFNITSWDNKDMILKVMDLFPCGYLPIIENLDFWMAAFAEAYHRPIKNRPDRNGMAVAWVQLSHTGTLLDLRSHP